MSLPDGVPSNGRRDVRSGFALCLLVLLFVAINARWIWIYRHGLVLDIDEAGYLNYSLVDYYGLIYGGIPGWIAAIEMPSIQAPLTMALSSLVYLVTGPHVIAAFAIPLAAGAGCILATYALGRSMGSQRGAIIAAVPFVDVLGSMTDPKLPLTQPGIMVNRMPPEKPAAMVSPGGRLAAYMARMMNAAITAAIPNV